MDTTVREETLLTVNEVAEILKVPPSWVYEHTRERCHDRIPGFRLGKYWRFLEADVIAWLTERRNTDRPSAEREIANPNYKMNAH